MGEFEVDFPVVNSFDRTWKLEENSGRGKRITRKRQPNPARKKCIRMDNKIT